MKRKNNLIQKEIVSSKSMKTICSTFKQSHPQRPEGAALLWSRGQETEH